MTNHKYFGLMPYCDKTRENQIKLDRPRYAKHCRNPLYCLSCAFRMHTEKGDIWGAKITACEPKTVKHLFLKSPPEPQLHTAENYREIINHAMEFIKKKTHARGALLNLHIGTLGNNIHIDAVLIDAINFNHVSKYFKTVISKPVARTDTDYKLVARYCLKYPIGDYYRKRQSPEIDKYKLSPFPIDAKLIQINEGLRKIKSWRSLGCLHHRAKN